MSELLSLLLLFLLNYSVKTPATSSRIKFLLFRVANGSVLLKGFNDRKKIVRIVR